MWTIFMSPIMKPSLLKGKQISSLPLCIQKHKKCDLKK